MSATTEDKKIGFLKVGKFADLVGKHKNTIDNWFKEMEKQKIHFVQRVGKEKVYDDIDYEIAKHILQKQIEGWNMDGIYDALRSGEANVELRTEDSIVAETSVNITQSQFMELMKKVSDVDNIAKEAARREMERHTKLLIEDRQVNRRKRIDDLITQRRILEALKKEAKIKWSEKPVEDRFIKTGFFGRKLVEDINKKNDFIENYISLNYEDAVRKEFDLDNSSNETADENIEIEILEKEQNL